MSSQQIKKNNYLQRFITWHPCLLPSCHFIVLCHVRTMSLSISNLHVTTAWTSTPLLTLLASSSNNLTFPYCDVQCGSGSFTQTYSLISTDTHCSLFFGRQQHSSWMSTFIPEYSTLQLQHPHQLQCDMCPL